MTKNTAENTAAAAVAAAPRTLAEQIEVAQARLNKLLAKQNTQDILNRVAAGDTATFNYGRAEKARVLSGVISAVGDVTDERGRTSRLARISVGEGLDAESYKVRVADILTINGEAAPVDAADEDDAEPAEDGAADPLAGEGEDPLAAE